MTRYPALVDRASVVRVAREGLLARQPLRPTSAARVRRRLQRGRGAARVTVADCDAVGRRGSRPLGGVEPSTSDCERPRHARGCRALTALLLRAGADLPDARRGAVRRSGSARRDQLATSRLGDGVDSSDPLERDVRGAAVRRARHGPVSAVDDSCAVRASPRSAELPEAASSSRSSPIVRASDGSMSTSPVALGRGAPLMAVREDVTIGARRDGASLRFPPSGDPRQRLAARHDQRARRDRADLLAERRSRTAPRRAAARPRASTGRRAGSTRSRSSWEQAYVDGSSVLRTSARRRTGSTSRWPTSSRLASRCSSAASAARTRGAAGRALSLRVSTVTDAASPATSIRARGALVFYLRGVALALALVAGDSTATLREANGRRRRPHDVVVHQAAGRGLDCRAPSLGRSARARRLRRDPGRGDRRGSAGRRTVGFDVLVAERAATTARRSRSRSRRRPRYPGSSTSMRGRCSSSSS